jgi:hypothetical protein
MSSKLLNPSPPQLAPPSPRQILLFACDAVRQEGAISHVCDIRHLLLTPVKLAPTLTLEHGVLAGT